MRLTWNDDFASLYKVMGQQRYGVRLVALWKLQSGMPNKAVANFLGKIEKTVRLCRRSYESGGVDKLMSLNLGRGLKAEIKVHETLRKDIKALQDNKNGGRVKCYDVMTMIEEKYNRKYSISGTYKILNRLGFAWITSSSRLSKGDIAVQEEFQRNS